MNSIDPFRPIVLICALLVAYCDIGSAGALELNPFEKFSGGKVNCFFTGAIENEDLNRIQSAISDGCNSLWLDSDGGDVRAAIKIGKAVRSAELSVGVSSSARCASACVLIYAGGVFRAGFGKILIHRPYLESTGSPSFKESQQAFDAITSETRVYLKEVNVDPNLMDRMMSIVPESSVELSREELAQVGLGPFDPVFADYLDSRKAQKAGLSKANWIQKKADAVSECGRIDVVLGKAAGLETKACWERVFPEYFK